MEEHDHCHLIEDKNRILIALVCNFIGIPLEIYGGITSGSFSLLADGFHMVSHLGLLGFAYFAEIFCRFQLYSVFLNGLFLLRLSMFVLLFAFWKIIHPAEILSGMMFAIALIGLCLDLFQVGLLTPARKDHSKNMKGVFWHTISDCFLSLTVVLGGVGIYFSGFYRIDAIALFIFFPFIFWCGAVNLLKTSLELSDKK